MSDLASESSRQRDPDLRTQRADDQLLDRLGRGDRIEPHDEVEAMLAAWRQELPVPGAPDPALLAAIAVPAVRPKRRMARATLGVAASVALLGGGVTVAAAYASPDSPLWPVTRLVYGDLAESRMAQSEADTALADARAAAAEGRYTDAARLLADAGKLAGRVDDPAELQRLRAAIDSLIAKLPPDVRDTARPNPGKPAESAQVPPPGQGDPTQPQAPGSPADPGQQNENGNQPGAGNGGNGGGGNGAGNGGGNEGGDEGGDGEEDGQREPPAEPGKPNTTKATKTKPRLVQPASAPVR